MRNSFETWAAWGIVVNLAGSVSAQQAPTFKSSVDLVRLDVTVVDTEGKPIDGLEPRDFDVRVNGVALPVTTLRYLELGSLTGAASDSASTSASAEPSAGGRIIVVAVDEESLPPTDSARPLMQTIAAWIDRLTPADRMLIVALPPPGVRQKFTSERAALTRTLYKLHARASMRLAPPGAQGFGGNRATTASPRPDAPAEATGRLPVPRPSPPSANRGRFWSRSRTWRPRW